MRSEYTGTPETHSEPPMATVADMLGNMALFENFDLAGMFKKPNEETDDEI